MDGSRKQGARRNMTILCEYPVSERLTKLWNYQAIPSEDNCQVTPLIFKTA